MLYNLNSTPPSDSRYYSSSQSLLFPESSSHTTVPRIPLTPIAMPLSQPHQRRTCEDTGVRLSDVYEEYFYETDSEEDLMYRNIPVLKAAGSDNSPVGISPEQTYSLHDILSQFKFPDVPVGLPVR